jgi:hypothetical protein
MAPSSEETARALILMSDFLSPNTQSKTMIALKWAQNGLV